uniref:ATP synthase F0 subunit 8 n=1 Tax=Eoneureclipsis hainanensis TaxID=3043990 RepID=UPI002551EED1|nr:ATP synthase F0 subunit 8 [Eoneureclipsis hainanensis]WGT74385.1 ATP synthase F0 subunit 8 [Eoneureclipsis hainanensis]
MPQMNPMNWIMLMIYFMMMIKIFNLNIYFMNIYKSQSSNKFKIIKQKFIWKW